MNFIKAGKGQVSPSPTSILTTQTVLTYIQYIICRLKMQKQPTNKVTLHKSPRRDNIGFQLEGKETKMKRYKDNHTNDGKARQVPPILDNGTFQQKNTN